MNRKRVADRLAGLYELRSLQGYVRWKVRTDSAYAAVLDRLAGYEQPLLDLGCGVGLLPFFLRECGYTAPIIGIDFDERKIDVARNAARRYRQIDFIAADARAPLPENHNVVMLDVLQYLATSDQRAILDNVARAVPPGGIVIIRQGIRDVSWRHQATMIADAFGRAVRWMRAERLNFPSREEVTAPFAGFASEVVPLWGRTPFNNYLFVFTR